MTKTLVLVRHAHRDLDDPSADNGLSKRGREQAKAVKRFYKARFGKEGALLLSSPKHRCLETLEPLAEKLGAKVRVDERLLEGPGNLAARIDAFFKWWKEDAPRRIVACSHGDWIPLFLARAVGAELPLRKGGWAELTWEGESPRLDALLQELPEE